MYRFISKAALMAAAFAVPALFPVLAQEVVSVRPGEWNTPSTWSTGSIPDASTATRVIVQHHVSIPPMFSVTVPELLINDTLTVDENGILILSNNPVVSDLIVNGTWIVDGSFIHSDDALVSGATPQNSFFRSGSSYDYQWNTPGPLPVVSWEPDASFFVRSFNTNASITSDTWTQNFGNFIYECPSQGNFVDFNGRLGNVQGDLLITNTNNRILRLARGQSYTLAVGKNLKIEGPSEVWLGETSNAVEVAVGNDFTFATSATASSYLTLSGNTLLTIHNHFIVDTNFKLKFASAGGGSSEVRIGGDMRLLRGTIDALGAGRGTIVFNGNALQQYFRQLSASIEGHFEFTAAVSSQVELGSSLLYNTTGGKLNVYGELGVGSGSPSGPLQSGASGNTNTFGGVVFHPGSAIAFRGTTHQYLAFIPSMENADITISNTAGVTVLNNMEFRNFRVEDGELDCGDNAITITRDIFISPHARIHTTSDVLLSSTAEQHISLNGSSLQDLRIAGEARNIFLISRGSIEGLLSFESTDVTFHTNDSLTLVSSSPAGGGRIGPLLNGNSIVGKVNVQRTMPVGRGYRYIATPVNHTFVSDLMDDFPVTGVFPDPSTGQGINSSSPSLFYYDAVNSSWASYPQGSLATGSPLDPGRGYCAFIRNPTEAVTWDVLGEVKQGDVVLPVADANEGVGWNLVGNPYPCAARWDDPGWTKNGISPGIAVKDNNTGVFRVWDGEVGNLDDGVIAMGQAFWVRVTNENPSLVIKESAKYSGEAQFYRKDNVTDYIDISASQAGHTDHAFVRRRQHSLPGLDQFDIPKLSGEHISISVTAGDDGELALSSEENAGCATAVKLRLTAKNETDSVYVSIRPVGLFHGARFIITDSSNHRPYSVSSSNPVALPATTRTLLLNIISASPPPLSYELPRFICEQTPVKVKIRSDDAYRYTLHTFSEDGNTEQSTLLNDDVVMVDFLPGVNYRIVTEALCAVDTTALHVVKTLPDKPEVTSTVRCGAGEVTLTVEGQPGQDWNSLTYEWTDSGGRIVSSGIRFTPWLAKTREYAVRALDAITGCRGDTARVKARIEHADSVTIRRVGNTLLTGLDPPVQWYYEDKLLDWTSPWITLTGTGEYRIKKSDPLKVCDFEATYSYFEGPGPVYPNPARGYVSFLAPAILKDIISAHGISVRYLCNLACSSDECRLDIGSLCAGTYFFIFDSKGKTFKTRVFVY